MIKSTCSDLKLSAQSPHRLADYEEARDLLLRVFLKDGFCIAIFRFGAVALPEETESQLRDLVGKEACCLRLDGRYYIREAGP
jgi:hypothetical protein